jgi:hypothetical protein
MEDVRFLLLLIALTSLIFLLIGLYKPWVMLWWEDVQNRSKVLKVYGSLAIVFAIVYYSMQYLD